jgi:hypothetical protein
MRTREEHLAWCKQRALEYVETNDLVSAVASMGSDLMQHPETGCNAFLLRVGTMDAEKGDTRAVRRWIEGFH